MTHESTSAPDAPAESGKPTWVRGLLITLLVAVLAGVAFFGGAVVSAGFGLFGALRESNETTTIRAQPSVVTAVRELSRLETTSFHIERVIDLSEEQSRFWGWVKSNDAILLVAAADITAGVDLSKLREDDVRADPATRTIRMTLPPPEILTTDLDNERTYVHTRNTDVLAKRKEGLESRARQEAEASLRDAALDGGILERAKSSAERSIEALLRSFGYETVKIRWR